MSSWFTIIGNFLEVVFDFLKTFSSERGALIASITALFIAGGGGRWLLSIFYKPRLTIIGFRPYKQVSGLKVWRIIIKNVGNEAAQNVQADVVNIYDNGEERKNFLPIPLRWTHLDSESREILSGQIVYLDFFDDIPTNLLPTIETHHTIRICSRFGLDIPDFTHLKNETSCVEVAIFHKRRKPLKLSINTRIDLAGISSIASMSGVMKQIG